MRSLPATSRASVAYPDGHSEVRSFPVSPAAEDSGWVRVEASGICGTDVSLYRGRLPHPAILGHHPVGQIVQIGEGAAVKWGVAPGDWVAIEEYLPCENCPNCRAGRYRLCPDTDFWRGGRRIGLLPVSESPALWGGNSEYLYLPPNAVVHPLPPGLSPDLAVWALPLGNALDWLQGAGSLAPGESVAIIGPGYHGLAAVAAALHAGGNPVIVCGLPADRERLKIAEAMGAIPLESGADDLIAAVEDLTDGRMADVVLDTAGSGPETVELGVQLLALFGRLIVAGIKSPAVAAIDTSLLIRRLAQLRGVRGRAPERVRQSIDVLASGTSRLDLVPTAGVSLAGTGDMLRRLIEKSGPETPHVVVQPWFDSERTG